MPKMKEVKPAKKSSATKAPTAKPAAKPAKPAAKPAPKVNVLKNTLPEGTAGSAMAMIEAHTPKRAPMPPAVPAVDAKATAKADYLDRKAAYRLCRSAFAV